MPALAQLNLSTGEWGVTLENLEHFVPFVQVGFTADALPVFFDNLSFGFSAKVNNVPTVEVSCPQNGITYISTDQVYLSTDPVPALPDTVVSIDVWAENTAKRYEHSFTFVSIRPYQPYPSWTWNASEHVWQPPTDYPEDGSILYVWDEDSLSWIPEEE
jgi:hypothetical protein